MKPTHVTLLSWVTILSLFTFRMGLTAPTLNEQGRISNAVVNGSFEQHDPLSNKLGYFKTIAGWLAETGHIEIQRGNISGIRAFKGRDKVELDAFFNSTLTQILETQTDRYYSLDLYYSPRITRHNTDSNNVELWWNNTLLRTLNGNRKVWQYHHLDVSPQKPSSLLKLKGVGRNDGKGGLIDGISLTLTPYTSSNLIQNPSFERHDALNHRQRGTFDQIPNWVATRGKIELQRYAVGGRRAAEGIVKLELDSNRTDQVEQTVATQAGQRYEMSLSYAPRKNRGNSDHVRIFWDNTELATLKGNKGGWRRYRFDVLAEHDSTQIAFRGAGRVDGVGGQIDDVRLHRVPYSGVNQIINGSFEQHRAMKAQKRGSFSTLPVDVKVVVA